MIDRPNTRLDNEYSMLEQQAGLILSIGRRIEEQGETRPNSDLSIKREDLALKADKRHEAYLSLQEEKIIEEYGGLGGEDFDKNPQPLMVRFTKKGREMYEVLEKAYKANWLEIVKPAIQLWDSYECV